MPSLRPLFIGTLSLGCAILTGYSVRSYFGSDVAWAHDKYGAHETAKELGELSQFVKDRYVDDVDNKRLFENALSGMVAGLDPHSSYLNPQALKEMQDDMNDRFGGIGLQIFKAGHRLTVAKVLDDTPASENGLRAGDVILSADGNDLSDRPLIEAIRALKGPLGTQVKLSVLRPARTPAEKDKKFAVALTRRKIHIQRIFARRDGDLAYIRLTEFSTDIDKNFRAQLARLITPDAKGVVLDLRSNPGGRLNQAIAIARVFIDQGGIVTVKGRKKEESWSANNTALCKNLPLAVLVNGASASAAEIVAGAIKDDGRGILVGETTFGKGSVQSLIPIGSLGALRLTTARYYTPSGASIQGHGIAPDVKVALERGEPDFYRESDLPDALPNDASSVSTPKIAPPRFDLKLSNYPALPPENWAKFNPDDPATDFQLRQAEAILRDMPKFRKPHDSSLSS